MKFTVKDLKGIIKDLPDDMPVALLDTSTDDFYDSTYTLSREDFEIDDWIKEEDQEEPSGVALFITFDNKLNPNRS